MAVDLSTQYLGLNLKNPLVISACPLTEQLDVVRRLEDGGAAALVMPSLFEEQIEHDEVEMNRLHEFGSNSFAESLTYFPELEDFVIGTDAYLGTLEELKRAVDIPVIASLNGTSEGGWVRYAKMMQDAGADAVELNIYFVVTDLNMTAQQVEQRYLDLIRIVKESISIPLAVKVGPYFSSMGNMARQMVEAGADGLVLFNRFLQPDIDLEELKPSPRLVLSTEFEMLLPLRWIAILRGQIDASLAITSGLHTAEGLIKSLLAGADVGMVASMLYREGVHRVGAVLEKASEWMEEHQYESVEQLKGSVSHENSPDPAAFERGNYMKALTSFTGEAI